MADAPGAAARGAALDDRRRADPARPAAARCRRRRTSREDFARLLDAGIDDWGGVSPVTIDHVNPEAPWPELELLRAATESRGLELAPAADRVSASAISGEWLDPDVLPPCCARRTRSGSRARTAGRPARPAAIPFVVRATRSPIDTRAELGEDEIVAALPRARRGARSASSPPPTGCGARSAATTVTYVVTRNIQYTNVCYFRCGFCAFSKGKLAANLRGAPYLVPHEEIVRRCEEAWERGATEVCLQGGIHPAFTGDYYLSVVRAIKEAVPGLHVHAFSALEVWQGAATLDAPARRLSRGASRRGAELAARNGGRDPRRRGAPRHLPRQGDDGAVARGARRGASRRAALERDDHVRACREPAELGAPLAARARAAAPNRRLHGVRAAAVRAHGGADLAARAGALGADVR